MKETTEIKHKYYFTFGEIKEALGIKGELYSSDLWRGLSPAEESKGESRDKEKIEIVTIEKI